uniref:Uncharacterized protein n=1 Tax=viral metagenome TaxID=1070528 RepID=A0A6M3IJT5_9ZZZZ
MAEKRKFAGIAGIPLPPEVWEVDTGVPKVTTPAPKATPPPAPTPPVGQLETLGSLGGSLAELKARTEYAFPVEEFKGKPSPIYAPPDVFTLEYQGQQYEEPVPEEGLFGTFKVESPENVPSNLRGEAEVYLDELGNVIFKEGGIWKGASPTSWVTWSGGEEVPTQYSLYDIFNEPTEAGTMAQAIKEGMKPLSGFTTQVPPEFTEKYDALRSYYLKGYGETYKVVRAELEYLQGADTPPRLLAQKAREEAERAVGFTIEGLHNKVLTELGVEPAYYKPNLTATTPSEFNILPGQGEVYGYKRSLHDTTAEFRKGIVGTLVGTDRIEADVLLFSAIEEGFKPESVTREESDSFMGMIVETKGEEINTAVADVRELLLSGLATGGSFSWIKNKGELAGLPISPLAKSYLDWLALTEGGGFSGIFSLISGIRTEAGEPIPESVRVLLETEEGREVLSRIGGGAVTGGVTPYTGEPEVEEGAKLPIGEEEQDIYNSFIRKTFKGYPVEVLSYLLRYSDIFRDMYNEAPPVKGDPVVESLRAIFPAEIAALETYNLPIPERLKDIARQKGWKEPVQGFLAYLQNLDKNVFEALLPGHARTAKSTWEVA